MIPSPLFLKISLYFKYIIIQAKPMSDLKEIEKLTKKLINFTTENFDDKPSGYTLELLEFVQSFLMDSGIRSQIHEYELERIIDGKKISLGSRGILLSEYDDKKPVILLQGHADTVPIARKFEDENCLVEEGMIFGRGAVDMKSSLAAMTMTVIKLKENRDLQYQPVLLITSDEEAGSFAGIKKFIEIYKKAKPDIRGAICGEVTDFAIKHDFLGAMYLRFHFAGKSGHAANKGRGDNAIEKAIPLLNDLVRFQNRLIKQKNALGQAVMNIGTIRGGEKVNQIPTACSIEVSLRTIKKNDIYEKEFLRLAKKNGGRMEKVFSYEPTRISSEENLIRSLKKSMGRARKQETIMREFTEATLLNQVGIKTIVFGPGNPLLNHSDEERIKTRDIARYQDILEKLIVGLG